MVNALEPLVYVLVLNYCSTDDTLAGVDAVRNVAYTNCRLLVIDNNSPDGGGRQLASQLPPSEFLQLPINTGYAGGNNEGIRIALADGADYILILNPDVRLPRESITHYVKTMKADPAIGALNPIQLSPNGKSVDEKFERSVLSPYNVEHRQIDETGSTIITVKTLLGATLMLPRHAIEKVGGFDPLFFAYGEEEDLCRRIRNHKFKLVVTESAPVIHLRTKEATRVSDFVLFLRLKGSYLYKLKNPAIDFRYAAKQVARDFIMDLFFRRKKVYPFNAYEMRLKHVLKTGLWILLRLPIIRRHRKLDKVDGAYI